jgi:hypothetical protein
MADHTIEWYGPKRGKGSVEDIVSHMPAVREEVGGRAMGMAREAAALLEAHRGRHYARSAHPRIVVQPAPPRKLDWWILLEADLLTKNPQADASSAAMGIEFGDRRARGDSNLPGLHILGRIVGRNVRRF